MVDKNIDTIYKEHVDELFSYAMSLGFDRDTSLDAIHDVFYKMCSDKSRMDNILNIRFYLLRMLKNRLLDLYRMKKENICLDTDATGLPFTIRVTIEESLIEDEEQEAIRRQVEKLLEGLTNRQREIVYLRYTQGYDYEAIAQLMHISVAACRKLFHKAVVSMRKKPGGK